MQFSAKTFKFLFDQSFIYIVGVGINFKPLDSKEISALDKILVDKLMTFGLANLPFNLPSITLAILFSPNMLCSLLPLMFSSIFNLYRSLNTLKDSCSSRSSLSKPGITLVSATSKMWKLVQKFKFFKAGNLLCTLSLYSEKRM